MSDSEYPVHVEVENNVHLVRGKNKSRFPQANSVLIDDDILTLIDAGAHIGHINMTMRDLGHEPSDLDRIILTHFHIDHKGHSEQLREVSDCEVLCHPLAEQGIVSFDGMVDYYGIENHEYFGHWDNLLQSFLPHVKSSYEITGYIEDRKSISCGSIDLIPVHTPGHTIDHTVFGINGFDLMLLVDIDLTSFGPWYGNVVSNIQDFKNSVESIIELGPKTAISSHLLKPVSENLGDILASYLAEFDRREERILKLVQSGKDTIKELIEEPTIYPRIPTKAYLIFEEFMIRKHLEDLEEKGILEVEKGIIEVI